MYSALLPLLMLLGKTLASQHLVVVNNCPSTINVYINNSPAGSLAANGGQTSQDFANKFSGVIYTDANGGNSNGVGATRAGFFPAYNYTYIQKDPHWLNTGMKIEPINRVPAGGFCTSNICETFDCPGAFNVVPHFNMQPPPMPGVPPSGGVVAQCPSPDTGYTVTFCPSGSFPDVTHIPEEIHPIPAEDKCVDVRAAAFTNGTAVQIYDCNDTAAQKWLLKKYRTKVQLAGTNFCLDAGSNPTNGVKMKIWKCFNNLPAQEWYWDDNFELRLWNTDLCLDVTDGVFQNSQPLQVWECSTTNNPNQAFEVFNSF